MKKTVLFGSAFLVATGVIITLVSFRLQALPEPMAHCPVPVVTDGGTTTQHAMNVDAQQHTKGCVFKTVFEGEGLDSSFVVRTPELVVRSEQRGLEWLVKAQAQDGGYGAGTHARQDIVDPHQVGTDPATTAMVAMALMRMGSTLDQGAYRQQLKNATEYLLVHVEKAPKEAMNVTELQGTQIQVKLGANIDVALTAQFLANLSAKLGQQHPMKLRTMRALNTCVGIIQRSQNSDGSVRGDGWAGVLQSSFAANALESAKSQGAEVDDVALDLARDYQKANFNVATGAADTERAAGVTLYAVSSSTRNSAAEAREAKEVVEKAKKDGRVANAAPVNQETLEQAGYTPAAAQRMTTSYEVFNAAKGQAQDERVLNGFGNNGGEEFLSFLQTGESLIIGKDEGWKNWYQKTTGGLVSIQNQDGSWNGHHCITSPVFCTATSLLILSVNNDIDHLLAQGAVKYR